MALKPNNLVVLIALWLAAVVTPFALIATSPHYFFNIHAVGTLMTSYFVGALGIVIARKGLDLKERQQLFLLSVCFFFWLWGVGIADLCRYGEAALAVTWNRVATIAVAFIAAQIYSFTVALLKLKRKKWVTAGYVTGGIFAVLNILSHYFVDHAEWHSWGYFGRWEFPRTFPFMLYFTVGLSVSLWEFIQAYRRSNSEHLKNQIKYIISAFAISYLGSVDYLPAFGYNVYPCGYVAIFGWWTILAYAILRYRLMDITIIIRKTLIYSVVMGVLTSIYLGTIAIFTRLFEGLSGYQTVFSTAVAACLITIGFQPLRKKVQAFVDSRFFRAYVDRDEKLYELSQEVVTPMTPEAMGQTLLRVVDDTLHPKSAGLFLLRKSGGFARAASLGDKTLPESMPESSPLSEYFAAHSQPLVQDLPDRVAADPDAVDGMLREDAA